MSQGDQNRSARYEALVAEVRKLGLEPEDVPRALEELRRQIEADLAALRAEKREGGEAA